MTRMMTFVMCLAAAGLMAQDQRPVDPREQCLMATGADWARLGIDGDQILRVNAIQSECLQDCVAAKERGTGISAVLDRHVATLRTVLSPDQFRQWSAWCQEKHGGRVDQ